VVAFRRAEEDEVPPAKCFGFVQTYDQEPHRRVWQLTIAVAMIAVAVFSLVKKDSGTSEHVVSNNRKTIGYLATFLLAVYGGFFSGGYVTMLTAVLVLLFGLTSFRP
jgi:uncharacterized membrane protein YfcA